MNKTLLFPLLAIVLSGLVPMAVDAQTPPNCQFVLGFQTVRDLIPATVGNCIDNQTFAANGDALQHTSSGLLAWRKADNWTAFTDGYHTWINGPSGIQQRLNTQRYSWEGDAQMSGLPVIDAIPLPSTAPTASPLTSVGCQNSVQLPSTFDGSTFVFGPNRLAINVPRDWCVRYPITMDVDAFQPFEGTAVLLGPLLGEQITLAITGRDGLDGANKAMAYFTGGTRTPTPMPIAGVNGWAASGFNTANAKCPPPISLPICLPNQWGATIYLPIRPADGSNEMAIRAIAPAGAKPIVDALLASAHFLP